jgi:cobalt-zinc-cadmium efflux system membrane fusion protein
MRRYARFVVLSALASMLPACPRRLAPQDDEPASFEAHDGGIFVPDGSPLRSRLEIAPAQVQEVRGQLVTPASVEAEPTRLAKIAPPMPGRVVKLFVRFGDTVQQGQPLYSLDSPDLVAAQSDYLKAKSAFAQAERNVARQKDLADHGIGAQRELEQAQTERDTAKSELERATTRLRLLGMGAGAVGGPLVVTSPIAGRVIELSTSPGQYQNDPAQPIMIVADLSTVWISANVQEKDVRRVHPGDEAVATFAAYPGEPFPCKVLFVGDLLDPETRTVKVRISLPNGDGRLKPGMFATVTFQSKSLAELVVPTSAVVVRGDKSQVFVETAPWTFTRRDVELGDQMDGKVAIVRGLEPGTRIVVANAVLLP